MRKRWGNECASTVTTSMHALYINGAIQAIGDDENQIVCGIVSFKGVLKAIIVDGRAKL